MPFGYRLRSQQSSRTQVDEVPQPTTSTSSSSSSGRHHSSSNASSTTQPHDTHAHASRQPLQRIRLDGDSSSNSASLPPPQLPPQQSQNNYLQQRLERAVSHRTPPAPTTSSSHSRNNHNALRRDRELSRSVLETQQHSQPHVRPTRTMTTITPPPPATASFLHDHTQTLELPQQHRQRRGTTSASAYSTRSTTSSSSAGGASDAPVPRSDVLLSGTLLLKRGLLKGLEKRFYFVTRTSSGLYSCKDETSFNLWHAAGFALDDVAATAKAQASGLAPLRVCSILRADRAGDAGSSDRAFVVVAAPPTNAPATLSAPKLVTFKLFADSTEKRERWLRALHRVQQTKRNAVVVAADPLDGAADAGDVVASPRVVSASSTPNHSRKASRSDASQSSNQSNASSTHSTSKQHDAAAAALSTTTNGPRAFAHGQLLRATSSLRDETHSNKSSTTSSSDDAIPPPSDNLRPRELFGSMLAANHGSSNQSNVLLFVPAAGSAIAMSDSKLASARKELQALVAQGAKRPTRRGLEVSISTTASVSSDAGTASSSWRFGTPNYVLADVEYMKNRLREPDATPLESYVEECVQTFVLDATHRLHYRAWRSVQHDVFTFQVNDAPPVAGRNVAGLDLFGLLCVHDVDVDVTTTAAGQDDGASGNAKDPRAMLAEAFTDGFPLEVLEVYTQPPTCYFSWRHWGPFTGQYKGVKGDGTRVEIRGFGHMRVDSHRMQSLRLFVKPHELFETLYKQSVALGAKARDVQRTRATSAAALVAPPPSLSKALEPGEAATEGATTTIAVPVVKTKAMLTADIMDELAGFTIASSTATAKS